jgi:site-specific DNA-methyltransferase (adenine-specific)
VTAPYWASPDGDVQLFHGDMRAVLPALGLQADLVLADPPYSETSLAWDRWPDGWVQTAARYAPAMWCFGSQRMFFDHLTELAADWSLSQDVIGHDDDGPVYGDVNIIWEKRNGTGFATDRFKRVHEHVLHWYRGPWGGVHHNTPRVAYDGPDKHARARTDRGEHLGSIGAQRYEDDGTRLMRSVIKAKSVRGQRRNETETPLPLLEPLIQYGCPRGGLVLDVFSGSGAALEAARMSGRRAIGIELRESQCETAARRLDQLALEAS